MPDFVNWCNQHQLKLVFHPVWYPFHSSLWNWDSDNLMNCINQLRNHRFEPGHTTVQLANMELFKSFIVQLENWHKGALKREESKIEETLEAHGLDELKTMFLSYARGGISNTLDKNAGDEASRMENVNEKCKAIFDSLGDITLKNTLVQMLQFPAEQLAGEIENRPIDRVVEKFRFATTLTPYDSLKVADILTP
ncbi:hypothetical protein BH09BAC1_BH09BAC1_13940 [soil metagenome]